MNYIILYQIEKPANLGNIMRTIQATSSKLIIIGPLSFSLNNKDFRRAGMDYIEEVDYEYFDSIEDFYARYKNANIYYVTRYSKNIYSNNDYSDIVNDQFFMFGKESSGIPHNILKDNFDKTIRIPMTPDSRSLNLSNCVALVIYEVLRQQKFYGLATKEEIKGEDFLFNEAKND